MRRLLGFVGLLAAGTALLGVLVALGVPALLAAVAALAGAVGFVGVYRAYWVGTLQADPSRKGGGL